MSAARAEVQDCIEITVLPAVITQHGVHCLKHDLTTTLASGNAIRINTDNVTIEMNGFKLGGNAAGASTQAVGIYALDRQNITIRNGSIRGFRHNVLLDLTGGDVSLSSGHIVDDMRIEGARSIGIFIEGVNSIVRNNLVLDTGNGDSSTSASGVAIYFGNGHSITGNIVTGVTETNNAYGIFAFAADAPHIRGNQIRDIDAANTYGISSTAVRGIIQDNMIANTSAGTIEITASGASDACLDNVVSNFATLLSGCSLENGNRGL